MEHWEANMAAIIGKDGSITTQAGNYKDKGRYTISETGRDFYKNLNGRGGWYLYDKDFKSAIDKGYITDNEPPVATGNAGIMERNTASHSSGMDMFGSGDWLTRGRFWEDNILRHDTLASGSLLSIGGKLG